MFAVIYKFEVKPDKTKEFIQGWEGLTKIIRKHCGGLGSRLHQSDIPNEYIAYAQWPDEETWKNPSKNNLPSDTDHFRQLMDDSLVKSETIHKMLLTSDLLLKID